MKQTTMTKLTAAAKRTRATNNYSPEERAKALRINAMRKRQARLREMWLLYDMEINRLRQEQIESFAKKGLSYERFEERQKHRCVLRRGANNKVKVDVRCVELGR